MNSGPCATEGCAHLGALHLDLTGRCRVSGCGCTGYAADADQRGSRRICVDVPDGYSLHVSLVPVGVDMDVDVDITTDTEVTADEAPMT